MTNEELIAKVEELYNTGEYSEAIALIESVPQEQRTYQLQYILASAYSDDIESDDNNQLKALKILKQISYQGIYDLKWLYLIAKTYFFINQEEYAIEYFDKLMRIVQQDKDIANLLNMNHFVDRCKETLYERALAVVFVAFKNTLKDDKMLICDINNNKIGMLFPKYDIQVNMEICHLRRSGATISFEVVYSDNSSKKYKIDGDAQTYEYGIAEALHEFVNIIEKEFK